MNTDLTFRIILDVAVVGCIFLGWWFIALPLAVLCAWAFPYYIELVGEGLLYDSLFGLGRGLGVEGFIGIIVSLVLGAVLILLKAVMKL